jgi:hypothetical protein
MDRLTTEGATAYIQTSVEAFEAGALAIGLLRLRMRFVKQHSERGSHEAKVAGELAGNEPGEEWQAEPTEERRREQGHDESGLVLVDSSDEFRPPMLRFVAAAATGMSMWYFNQYDADYHPSIPHGHHVQARPGLKLDAYLGHVYRGSTQVRREPRANIVALWNDQKFRQFARTAISWYMASYPAYRWRVADPLRIPRRRS